MPYLAELDDADYPNIWASDAFRSEAAVSQPGEQSLYLLSVKGGVQTDATKMKVKCVAAIGAGASDDLLQLYVWRNALAVDLDPSAWVLLTQAHSADAAEKTLARTIDMNQRYVNAAGIVYFLLTTAHTEKPITLNFFSVEFNDLGRDGILTQPPQHTPQGGILSGVTNEWVMGVQLKAYHPSESSIWKPEAYSDYWPLVNRCTFFSPEMANDPTLTTHTSYGQRISGFSGGVLMPEAPTALNYAPLEFEWSHRNNVNQMLVDEGDTVCEEWRRNFYRSCRIYEPEPEIESAVTEMEGATELVKITFKTRFHHADGAPGAISRDIAAWNIDALRAEANTLRTTENGLREYLVNQTYGTNATFLGPGNNAANATVQSNPCGAARAYEPSMTDTPYGSCYPTFYFVQLIPSPYEDGNNQPDKWDAPVTHDVFLQMELYLRAMCEGYVDGNTSAAYACAHNTSTLYDYAFENLCLDAFGNRWFNLLPLSVRPDNIQGFGPMPNTDLRASTFNQFSSAINLLTRARVMLPMTLEAQFGEGTAVTYSDATGSDGTPSTDCTDGNTKIYWDGTPPDAGASYTDAEWTPVSSVGASVHSYIGGDCGDLGSGWPITTIRHSANLRWRVTDPDAIYALPPGIQGLLTGSSAVLASITTVTESMTKKLVGLEDSEGCCDTPQPPGWWNYGGGLYWVFPKDSSTSDSCAIIPSSVNAAPIGGGTLARGNDPSSGGDPRELGPTNTITVHPIIESGAMVQVPLV